jgi:uncharacterized integral membrane protein
MKTLYLVVSVILTVMILILGFENVGSSCTKLSFFFMPINTNPTLVIIGIAVLGMITGASYLAFLQKLFAKEDEEEEETGF